MKKVIATALMALSSMSAFAHHHVQIEGTTHAAPAVNSTAQPTAGTAVWGNCSGDSTCFVQAK